MMATRKRATLRVAGMGLLAASVMALAPLSTATADGFQMESANNDITNQASLQRGAKYYMNYCLGCHSLEHVRYQRLSDDLGIPEEQFLDNLAFTGEELGDMVKIGMPPEDSEDWFGVEPPDLSLVARSRGSDWIYNFLRSFYVDDQTLTGTNNKVLENTAMPHVLWSYQGYQEATYEEDRDGDEVFAGFETIQEGRMSAQEYDRMVRDITNFLDYVGEPIRADRQRMGFWVLAFIGVFIFFAWLLKREYWRDIK